MKIKEIISSFNEEDFFSRVNLHVHSNFSDGKLDFDVLVEQAKTLDMKYISITDHNCIEGYKKTKYLHDPILIKGVEFDCFYKMSPLHILGYGIDVENEKINKLCSNEQNDLIRLFKSRHPKRAIEAIHDAGGIAVLAHPCCSFVLNLEDYVKKLQALGLDGIEVFYPYGRFRAVLKFSSKNLPLKIAQKLNLIKTGGSDEHKSLI